MAGKQRRWGKQLLDDLTETREYWKLEEEALDRTLENSLWKWLRPCRQTDYERNDWYHERITNHEAPQCTVVYILLSLPPSLTQISSSAPYFETPSASGLPSTRLDQVPDPYKTVYVCIPSEVYFPCFGTTLFTSRTTWHSYTLPSANLVNFQGSSDRADFYPALFLAQPPSQLPFP